jgi:hypothetical protein
VTQRQRQTVTDRKTQTHKAFQDKRTI